MATFALLAINCGVPDEGELFSNSLATFATALQDSNRTEAILVWTPEAGVDRLYTVDIGVTRRCPNPPCAQPTDDMQGVATVKVQRGTSGSGYSYTRALNVPVRLTVTKKGAPVRIYLRKHNGVVEAYRID